MYVMSAYEVFEQDDNEDELVDTLQVQTAWLRRTHTHTHSQAHSCSPRYNIAALSLALALLSDLLQRVAKLRGGASKKSSPAAASGTANDDEYVPPGAQPSPHGGAFPADQLSQVVGFLRESDHITTGTAAAGDGCCVPVQVYRGTLLTHCPSPLHLQPRLRHFAPPLHWRMRAWQAPTQPSNQANWCVCQCWFAGGDVGVRWQLTLPCWLTSRQ